MEPIPIGGRAESEEPMELPPGFRFHPTDEELITHYLSKKVVDGNFSCRAIGDVDLNKCEPWDLHWKAKMGEKEWYFFCVKDRKYPTGLRTNRATEAGYWKATGKDKEIHRGKILVGMKKTLVFYRGRAPKGEKTCWVMHEYRIECKSPFQSLPKSAKNEWVICRVFQKNLVVKRSYGEEMGFSRIHFPPLTETNFTGAAATASYATQHVPRFSTAPEGYFTTHLFSTPTNNTENITSFDMISKMAFNSSFFSGVAINSGDGECKFDGEMVSVSQDTGLTSDVNPEISSMFSTHRDVGKQMLYSGELPLAPAMVTMMEDSRHWNY